MDTNHFNAEVCLSLSIGVFSPLQDFLYPYGTAIFIFLCSVIWLYLYLCLPETKGQSVEDITIELRRRTGEKQTSIQNGPSDQTTDHVAHPT